MHKDYKSLFQTLSPILPPERLSGAIVAHIEEKERRSAGVRAVLLSIATLFSFAVAIPVSQNVFQELLRSGFFHYFSLLFSDSAVILAYWKEFSLSLAESLPFAGMIILLTLTLAFLSSLRSAARNTKIALSHFHFIS